MNVYAISSKAAVDYGIYEGETPDEAVSAMLDACGFDAREESTGTVDDWDVTMIEWVYYRDDSVAENSDYGRVVGRNADGSATVAWEGAMAQTPAGWDALTMAENRDEARAGAHGE